MSQGWSHTTEADDDDDNDNDDDDDDDNDGESDENKGIRDVWEGNLCSPAVLIMTMMMMTTMMKENNENDDDCAGKNVELISNYSQWVESQLAYFLNLYRQPEDDGDDEDKEEGGDEDGDEDAIFLELCKARSLGNIPDPNF